MRWKAKAAVQRILAQVPVFGKDVYYILQRYLGGLRDFSVEHRLENRARLLESLEGVGANLRERETVEIGTGWVPVIPMLFWLLGHRSCDTYDIAQLLDCSLVTEAARQLAELVDDDHGTLCRRLPWAPRTRRVQSLRHLMSSGPDGGDVLRHCSIRYHAPASAAHTPHANQSIDVVYSNLVLEHVTAAAIDGLFSEAFRILRPGGYMVHLIDTSDHFSHCDQSISSVNFLQFSEESFEKYNTFFCFKNRLRASQWREIIGRHGFEIAAWKTTVDREAIRSLDRCEVDREFMHFELADPSTTSVQVVAVRP